MTTTTKTRQTTSILGSQRSKPESSTADLWPSYGKLAVKWIETNLVHAEGDYFGQPFRLLPPQKLFLYRWYEYHPVTKLWRYQRALKGEAKGGGKTELLAAIGCLEFAGPKQIAPRSPNVPIGAASYEQADLLFGAAGTMLGGTGGVVTQAPLREFFEVYDTEILFKDGRPGRMYRIAAVAGTNDGGKPTLFIADEVHEWTDRKARVHTVVSNGLAKRRNGRELNCSTAGAGIGSIPPREDDSLLWKMYAEGKMQQADPSVSPEFLFDWYEADTALDLEDDEQLREAIRQASPAAGLLWDVEDRVKKYHDPKVPVHEFRRYFLNQWVEAGAGGWLADRPAAWRDCEGPASVLPGADVYVGVDMGLYRDSTAVAVASRNPETGRVSVGARVWVPEDGRIDHLAVMQYLRELCETFNVMEIDYDSRFFEVPAQTLLDEGLPMIDVPQSPERMVPACGYAYEAIVGGVVEHDGDPVLTSHVLTAVRRDGERGWTLSKGKSKNKIDACIAMVLALWAEAQSGLDSVNVW